MKEQIKPIQPQPTAVNFTIYDMINMRAQLQEFESDTDNVMPVNIAKACEHLDNMISSIILTIAINQGK